MRDFGFPSRCRWSLRNFGLARRGYYYSRDNSTTSPASSAGNVSKPSLLSQVGRVREVPCDQIRVFPPSERRRRQYSSAYVAATNMWLRQEDQRFLRLALKAVIQSDGDFVDVILLYLEVLMFSSIHYQWQFVTTFNTATWRCTTAHRWAYLVHARCHSAPHFGSTGSIIRNDGQFGADKLHSPQDHPN
jgi:hypothetical protein